jgi:hypothetical protein
MNSSWDLPLMKTIDPHWRQQNDFVHKIMLPYLHIQIRVARKPKDSLDYATILAHSN